MKRTTLLALAAMLWLAAPSARAATTYVHSGDNLQTALNNASPGDVLVLDAGASFTGPFTLPNKGSGVTQYITITSSALASLPGQTRRVSPADASNSPRPPPTRGSRPTAQTPALTGTRWRRPWPP